ncbi:sacsin N-terminal ATP-binding-like domain-containing protein [Caldalkalibacillus salinus]|uniref:sacsin N-terminal ATP-binding-like domain-containing protein n=1 Tax=Caldalkalibacillus salinus TaxID=2803787 RepID=UPI001922745A|nr:hypothetical protein [Caldalkalibacillus salinus]
MKKDKYFEIALNTSTSKIFNELKNIKESSDAKKNEIRRRWIWELIQNASDCTPKDSSINISLEVAYDRISFSHDGTPFSYDNLFSLITQCSEKQLSEDKLTGKFGTGFMSTFLLSEIVELEGTFICENGNRTDMNFTIDRTNGTYPDIRNKTEEMLSELDTLNHSTNGDMEKVNKTKFIYNLNGTPESLAAVKQGVDDLIASLPYLLAFNQNINSINYNGLIYERATTDSIPSPLDRNIFSIKTNNVENDTPKYILCLKRNNVTIACPVTYDFDTALLSFLRIPENMPKLFCNFPLIGSEDYAFPIIVNSDLFDVEIDRNAIRDGNAENKKIIEEAVYLYKKLIDYCTDNVTTRDEFKICLLKSGQYYGLQKYCYDEIKDYIEKKPLIPINSPSSDYERMSYLDDSGDIQIHLPKAKKGDNDLLFWELFTDGGYVNIPTRDTFLGWRKVFGGNFYLEHINSMLKEMNIAEFNGYFKDEFKTCEWLNRFYSLWVDDESMEEVIISAFVPTQENNFRHVSNVSCDSNINEELKGILFELDSSYKKKLLNLNISAFDSFYEKNPLKLQDTKSCADLIEHKVTAILSEETVNQAERNNEVQVTFNKLTDFFLKEPKLAEDFLPKSLSKRMLLSTPEETLRRMKIAEKVERNGIDMKGLDELINNQQQIKNILANPQLDLEQIRELLKHVVTSTSEMRKYFEALLERSVSNVYSYLKELQRYSLPTTLEEWKANQYTETIFPIKKDEKELTIVIRPTDGDQIIFHDDGELEVLDSTEYELWTDNGTEQKNITLGDLLKTTGISKIPLRKL